VTSNAKTRRRSFGALCLLAAILLLVADEYLLKGRLSGVAFLAYWLVCFLFTVLAIVAACLDVRELRRTTRSEQRALLENTLHEIGEEKSRQERHPKEKSAADR